MFLYGIGKVVTYKIKKLLIAKSEREKLLVKATGSVRKSYLIFIFDKKRDTKSDTVTEWFTTG